MTISVRLVVLTFFALLAFWPANLLATIPSAPQNLQSLPGNGQNFLGWQAPSSNGGATITSYRVFRGTTSSNQQLVTSGGLPKLGVIFACTDTGLTNGQIYYYLDREGTRLRSSPPPNPDAALPLK